MATSIIQPVSLDLTDGREIQLLVTTAAAMRIRDRTSGEIDLITKPYIENKDVAATNLFVRMVADCCVKWSETKRRWVYDDTLNQEADEDLCELVEIVPAMQAIRECMNRSNKGLPRMPPPQAEATVASTNPENPTTPKPNGSASGLALAAQE